MTGSRLSGPAREGARNAGATNSYVNLAVRLAFATGNPYSMLNVVNAVAPRRDDDRLRIERVVWRIVNASGRR